MTYKALYREWRPKDFSSLVGQNHIRQTLRNALLNERIAHAYLFTGPRGTGKTSTAKILAKAVNCLNLREGEPCNDCTNCRDVNEGRSLDVLEIDAASNRGIEEIRELKEKLSFAPSQGNYKVYIIDEVHMLTTEAFNALLKTLEEPPAHVIFVLATTEPQKIPATILSRCQRFDFKKITARDMEKRLQEILDAYEITAEEGVLAIIVKKAEGGMRDAISILDQCMAFSNQHLSLQAAYEVMGLVKNDVLLSLVQAIIVKDTAQVLFQVNALLQEGVEPSQVTKDLLEYWRNLLLLQVCPPNSELIIVDGKERDTMLNQGKQLGLTWLTGAIALMSKVEGESRWRKNQRIVLETTLINLIYQGEEQENDQGNRAKKVLADRIANPQSNNQANNQSNRQANKQSINQTNSHSINQTNSPTNSPINSLANAQTNAQVNAQVNAQTNAQTNAQANLERNNQRNEQPNNQGNKQATRKINMPENYYLNAELKEQGNYQINAQDTLQEPGEDSPQVVMVDQEESAPKRTKTKAGKTTGKKETKPEKNDLVVQETVTKEQAVVAGQSSVVWSSTNQKTATASNNPLNLSLAEIKDKWDQVMEVVKDAKKTLHAFLTMCTPYEIKEKGLVLLFKNGYTFHKEKVEEAGNKKIVQRALAKVVGVEIPIICLLEEEVEEKKEKEEKIIEEKEEKTIEDPIKKAMSIFGPEIVSFKD